MLKVFFLIFEPGVAWERIAQTRRGIAFVFFSHLLPLVALATAVEGWGLAHWGKWQSKYQKFKEFSAANVITFEVIQAILFLLMVFASALILQNMSQTFDARRTFRQAFTTMAYGFGPLFLAHMLGAGPSVHPAVPWAIGLIFTIWVLYQGVPRVMQPDPTHAFGLYLSTIFVVLLMSGIARLLTALYLLGRVDFRHSWFTHKFPSLFQ